MWPDVAGYLLSVDERRALPESIHAALAESPLFARPLSRDRITKSDAIIDLLDLATERPARYPIDGQESWPEVVADMWGYRKHCRSPCS